MEKLFRRINGLVHIAEKREKSKNEVDRLVGRQILRNLKMVKRIIGEEIVQCGQCRDYCSPYAAAEQGYIPEGIAELLAHRKEGYCTYKNRNDIVPLNGYCHRGANPCK